MGNVNWEGEEISFDYSYTCPACGDKINLQFFDIVSPNMKEIEWSEGGFYISADTITAWRKELEKPQICWDCIQNAD